MPAMPGAFVFEPADSVESARSERIFACNLDQPQGQAALSGLTRDAQPGSARGIRCPGDSPLEIRQGR